MGLAALVFPLVEGRQLDWPTWSILSLVASPILLGVFAWHQRRMRAKGGTPLIDPTLFRDRAFTVGVSATAFFFAATGSFFLVLVLYLQEGHHYGPLASGSITIIVGAGFFMSSALMPKLINLLGRQIVALGAIGVAVGYVMLIEALNHIGVTGSFLWLAPGMLTTGWGMGMVMAPLPATVLARVTPSNAAAASGVLSTAQEAGGAIGIALIGIVFFDAVTNSGGNIAHALRLALVLNIALATVIAGLIQLLPRGQSALVPMVPEPA